MEITFDQAKDKTNIAKHGVSLGDAELIKWDMLVTTIDARRDYKEERMIGFAPIGTRLHCVVFTVRNNELRIISLRKANKRELIDYANQN